MRRSLRIPVGSEEGGGNRRVPGESIGIYGGRVPPRGPGGLRGSPGGQRSGRGTEVSDQG